MGKGKGVDLSRITGQVPASSLSELLSPRTSHFLKKGLLWVSRSCAPAWLIPKTLVLHINCNNSSSKIHICLKISVHKIELN